MNIYDYYEDVTETFTFPNTPDVGTIFATVFFEWGDEVVESTAATHTTGNTYSIDVSAELVDSWGTWRVKWECEFSGSPFYNYTNFRVERPYTTEDSFMENYPDFDTSEYQGAAFIKAEKLARRIIDTYTGQEFQMIKGKTLEVDGNGRVALHMPYRINWFTEVTIDDVDYTASVELDPRSKYFLRMSTDVDVIDGPVSVTKFPNDIPVSITADWGWIDVPWQIQQATELLIVDLLDDTRRENHRYGIERLWQDTNRLEMKKGIFDTTGNTDVDVLIMDFVYWTLDYVT